MGRVAGNHDFSIPVGSQLQAIRNEVLFGLRTIQYLDAITRHGSLGLAAWDDFQLRGGPLGLDLQAQ